LGLGFLLVAPRLGALWGCMLGDEPPSHSDCRLHLQSASSPAPAPMAFRKHPACSCLLLGARTSIVVTEGSSATLADCKVRARDWRGTGEDEAVGRRRGGHARRLQGVGAGDAARPATCPDHHLSAAFCRMASAAHAAAPNVPVFKDGMDGSRDAGGKELKGMAGLGGVGLRWLRPPRHRPIHTGVFGHHAQTCKPAPAPKSQALCHIAPQ
jgi:hypothetical protein